MFPSSLQRSAPQSSSLTLPSGGCKSQQECEPAPPNASFHLLNVVGAAQPTLVPPPALPLIAEQEPEPEGARLRRASPKC